MYDMFEEEYQIADEFSHAIHHYIIYNNNKELNPKQKD